MGALKCLRYNYALASLNGARRIDCVSDRPILSNRVQAHLITALTLAGVALRISGLFSSNLHADEALYASWGRLIGTWNDPLLATQPLDKPPLFFYLQAIFFPLLGAAEAWVARLPNLAASILTIPLTARFARNLFDDTLSPLLAAAFVAFSPLLIRYSATVFIDPLLAALVVASLAAASAHSREARSGELRLHCPGAAGALLGLALVTKYQALLFIPLHLLLAALCGLRLKQIPRWIAGFAAPIVVLFVWLAVRGAGLGLWAQQMAGYGGLRLAWSWELWPRLDAWGVMWQELPGSPVLSFALLLVAPLFLALLIQQQDRASALDQLLLLFVLAYALIHWFLAVPVWDRYLIPVGALVAVLLARFVSRVVLFAQPALPAPARPVILVAALAVTLLMAPGGVQASVTVAESGRESIGESAARIAGALEQAPYGTVLYDHWYSWHWRFYLAQSRVYVSWFPHADALAADLDVFWDGSGQRYLVLPRDGQAAPLKRTLDEKGYTLESVVQTAQMTLYRLR